MGRNPETCSKECFDATEKAVAANADGAAAVVIEPLIQGASGMRPAPEGFLALLRRLATEYDLLLIADEVATGFGRTGTMFACEREDVAPDLMALAKGISGGYLPLAATAAAEKNLRGLSRPVRRIQNVLPRAYVHRQRARLRGGDRIATCVRGRTRARKPSTKDRTAENALRRLGDIPEVADVRQAGFMVGIELMDDPAADEPFPPERRIGHQVTLRAREHGAIIRPLGDVVILNPPLAISLDDIDDLVSITERAIREAVSTG
ncbi:MAG: aminotransferase class III-fold pyridoxal phosphate-dependent enzyme [Deltaproteobacteria bacterium]|nr:aminotransferase class III-fold pyridoxal phosphate-dependent enzyme [Deltaproteobacteria bacterium]